VCERYYFFFVFVTSFSCCFVTDDEQNLKAGVCLHLCCFVCRNRNVLQVAISDQVGKLSEPLQNEGSFV